MSILRVPGADLYYRIDDFTDPWQPSETVLLHHAAISNTERWRAWIPALARNYRVVRFDARGHGRSSVPPTDFNWSIEQLTDDARALIDHLDCGPVHFVGVSAGGIIGIEFAARHPDALRSLTLVASTPQLARTEVDFSVWLRQIETEGVRAFLRRDAVNRFSPTADPQLIDWFVDISGGTAKSVVTSFIPYMASVDLMDRLPLISVPVLLIAATQDRITPFEVQRLAQELIPDTRLIDYDTVGHNIAEEFADRCAADTMAFLDGLKRAV